MFHYVNYYNDEWWWLVVQGWTIQSLQILPYLQCSFTTGNDFVPFYWPVLLWNNFVLGTNFVPGLGSHMMYLHRIPDYYTSQYFFWGSSEALFARAFHQAPVMAAAMSSKNLSRCADVSFRTKFSKTLLGIEALGSPKGAWVWQRCMRLCWTRRSPITSAQVIKRKEEKVIVDGEASRELTKSRTARMLDLDQSFRIGNAPKASLQRGMCFVNLCIKIVCFLVFTFRDLFLYDNSLYLRVAKPLAVLFLFT